MTDRAENRLLAAVKELAQAAPRFSHKGQLEADDIAQDAAVRAVGVDAPEKVRDPGRYLMRIARNLFVDGTRKRAREAAVFDARHSGDPHARDPVDPERILAGKQELKVALDAIEALPPRCREAFRLHRFEEMSYAAIARHMGISVSMVEKHVSEAMRKIAAALGKERAS